MSPSARRLGAPIALLLALSAAAALAGCSADIATPTNRYAVVIGIQDYQSPSINDLQYPENDANELAAALSAGGWQVADSLLSSAATYAAIRSSIQTTLAGLVGSDENATVLLYYSGHGNQDTGDLVPYDTMDASKLIPPSVLSSWLDALPCKNKILILDSCYSGNFVIAGDSIDASPQDSNSSSGTLEDSLLETAVGNLSELIAASLESSGAPSVLAISAAGSADLSYETGAVSNGVFTYYLLKAAASGDANGDGYVTATEAFAYAKSCIKAYWNSVNAASYAAFLPHISGGTGDLVLYVNK